MISDVSLCVLCMLVLNSDLQVIHGDFQLFSTLHCSSWFLVCECIQIVVVFFLGIGVNQLPILSAIFDNYCQCVFVFVQPC